MVETENTQSLSVKWTEPTGLGTGRISKFVLIIALGAIIGGLSLSNTYLAHLIGFGHRPHYFPLNDDVLSITLGFACVNWVMAAIWIMGAHREHRFPWIAFSISIVLTLAMSFFTPFLIRHEELMLAALLTGGGAMLLLWLPTFSKITSNRGAKTPNSIEPKCPACGYCMRGLHHARCPECGEAHLVEQLYVST